MLRYMLLLIVFSSLFSCANNNQDVNLQKRFQTDTSAKATAILFAGPMLVDSSHMVIYPLILEKTSYDGGFSSSSKSDRVSYWNLVFYNTDNNTQHLLADNKRMVIYSIKSGESSSSSSSDDWAEGINIYKNKILYDVVSTDFNQNNTLILMTLLIYISRTSKETTSGNYHLTITMLLHGKLYPELLKLFCRHKKTITEIKSSMTTTN